MAISDWLRGLWKPTAQAPLDAASDPEVAKHVALAEEAYDRMVDSDRPDPHHDAAQQHFQQAIAAAQRRGLTDQVARLTQRRDAVAAAHAARRGGS
jgi:hypothetical protein